jgi:aldehyde dehydrogenase (NAD+)
MEFSFVDGGMEDCPGFSNRKYSCFKPAETTSLTALKLAEIIQETDLPPGVVNIITGAGATGAAIVNHPDINKIAFTGSTDVGKIIQKAIAGTNKKATLELGGKAANIIFEDAPIDQAVEGVVNGIYFNQGHVCLCRIPLVCARIRGKRSDKKIKRQDRIIDHWRPDG